MSDELCHDLTYSRIRRAGALLFLCFTASACATLSRGTQGKAADGTPAASGSTAEQIIASKDATPGDLTDTGADLQAIPLAVNRQVLKWIDYFQGQGRPHMERYLSRSSRYMPIMKSILRKEGLPEDLIYIALIESGFSSSAHSSANAVGYWQFIRGTGKRYGMKIDSYVDERRDFVRSTQGAAQYFKDLYGMFRSWYLAIASYNVGENRVKNVTQKYRTRDFWQLARENKLPEETNNYVPKFIAARLIAKEPEKYGFTDIDYQAPVEFTEVQFTTSIDLKKLAQGMNIEYDDLRDLNPMYKRGVAFTKNDKLMIRVPKGLDVQAMAAAEQARPEVSKRAYASDEDYSYYKVRRGDTVSSIAKKFATNQKTIRRLNGLSANAKLSTGRRLRVPGETVGGLASEAPAASKSRSPNSSPTLGISSSQKEIDSLIRKPTSLARRGNRIHIVRRGDTLAEIAKRYQVPLRKLATHNRLSRRSKISVGTQLEIP